MEEDTTDHVIWREENRRNYKISIVARLQGPFKYMVVLENPDGEAIDLQKVPKKFSVKSSI